MMLLLLFDAVVVVDFVAIVAVVVAPAVVAIDDVVALLFVVVAIDNVTKICSFLCGLPWICCFLLCCHVIFDV